MIQTARSAAVMERAPVQACARAALWAKGEARA